MKLILLPVLLVTVATCLMLYVWSTSSLRYFDVTASQRNLDLRSHSAFLKPPELKQMLKFVPKHNFTECVELFSDDTDVPQFQMSDQFKAGVDEFLARLANATKGRGPDEGHSYSYDKMYRTLHYLAQLDFVHTICETGFNAGHSAFNFLTANPSIVLHSFDLGSHHYVHKMGEYLKKKFGGRFFLYIGDSRQTVRSFIANRSADVQCDLFHVDGGHSYKVALRDMENFARLANLAHNVMFADNLNSGAGKAWGEMLEMGTVQELTRCMFRKPGIDLIGIGTVLRRHSLQLNDY